ncbi:MAG: MaoC family dehydratase N-terminal domain-containing protein [Magnetospirillum gryphiswaldense]|nr:MaoC family dehydratase N-terminal domain-containing protein [Magnetospirillum gryphiswaldense]
MSPPNLTDWIGRAEETTDTITTAPLVGLAATLDHDNPPWPSDTVPPMGHWLYFLPRALQRDIAADGHPHRGGFLPPVALPRRMWAGGQLEFAQDLKVGDQVRRVSTIKDVTAKSGRSGDMVFVAVEHQIFTQDGLAVREIHDIVYRQPPAPGTAPPPPEAPPQAPVWSRTLVPDPVLLFRYSALTFNGHRIHYDRDYCRDQEGYPGLVFHGPLTATLLADLFLRENPGARLGRFDFRAKRPLFDIHPLTLCGAPTAHGARMWALDHQGAVAMIADLEAK